jgi:hypothetical protein
MVTDRNHFPAASNYTSKVAVEIVAHEDSHFWKEFPRLIETADRQRIADELEVLTIAGASPGEVALCHPSNGETVITGAGHELSLLSRKYSVDEKEMRCAMRKLLARQEERLLCGRGMPILSGVSMRLRQLSDWDH